MSQVQAFQWPGASSAPEPTETIPVEVKPENESEFKRRFAVELLRTPTAPFEAAQRTFPGNITLAIFKSVSWPQDPEVLQYINELTETRAPLDLLPTKDALGRAVFDLVHDMGRKMDVKERLAGYRLYGEIMGFIDKKGENAGGVNVSVQNNIGNKVMIVKDHGTDDDWEAKLLAQQENLVAEARNTKIIDAAPE
jgi:hypothetical protein